MADIQNCTGAGNTPPAERDRETEREERDETQRQRRERRTEEEIQRQRGELFGLSAHLPACGVCRVEVCMLLWPVF